MNERFLVFCFLLLLWYHHSPSRSITMGSLEWWLDLVFRLHTHALRAEQKKKKLWVQGLCSASDLFSRKPRNGACSCWSIAMRCIASMSLNRDFGFFFGSLPRRGSQKKGAVGHI